MCLKVRKTSERFGKSKFNCCGLLHKATRTHQLKCADHPPSTYTRARGPHNPKFTCVKKLTFKAGKE